VQTVEARSFAEHGVVALRAVPIANNWPLGSQPEAYLHWPPLFPIVLSLIYRAFGESETATHSLMLCIFVANAWALYWLVKHCIGRLAALVAAFGWLVAPVNGIYAHLAWNLNLALLFTFISLTSFVIASRSDRLHPGWAMLGCFSYALAVLSSWEPVLMCPGLLAASNCVASSRSPQQIGL